MPPFDAIARPNETPNEAQLWTDADRLPTAPHTPSRRLHSSSADNSQTDLKTFPIRLSARSNALLRENFQYRGDMSARLAYVLAMADLYAIPIIRFQIGRPTKDDDEALRPSIRTSVRLDQALYQRVREAAEERLVSINEMLNSAIQAADVAR